MKLTRKRVHDQKCMSKLQSYLKSYCGRVNNTVCVEHVNEKRSRKKQVKVSKKKMRK